MLKLLLEIDDSQNSNTQNVSGRIRLRGNKLKVNINARTNNGSGCTALWLAEENHGVESEVARLLRSSGGISTGYGDNLGEEESEQTSAEGDSLEEESETY